MQNSVTAIGFSIQSNVEPSTDSSVTPAKYGDTVVQKGTKKTRANRVPNAKKEQKKKLRNNGKRNNKKKKREQLGKSVMNFDAVHIRRHASTFDVRRIDVGAA